MVRMRGVSAGALVSACSLFVLCGTLLAQETVDIAPARREILEALQRALQPSINQPLAPPNYEDAPPPAPVDVAAPPDRVVSISSQGIEYELTIVHLVSEELPSEEEQEVTGETFGNLLRMWREEGKIVRMSKFRLSALDNQAAFVQVGEQIPVTTGRTTFGGRGGGFQSAVEHREVGTLFGCTGRIEGNNIVLELDVEESRLEEGAWMPASPTSAVAGSETPASPQNEVMVPVTQQTKAQTTVTVPDGETAIVSALWTKSESETSDGSKKESTGYVIAIRASILW